MKILAISGWKRSGKDTLANYLIEKEGFKRISFADPLKDSVSKEFNIPREYLDDPKFKEKPLLNMPVDPQDDFSRMVANFLVLEFRNAKGNQEVIKSSGLYLKNKSNPYILMPKEQLYWTPRALAILKGSVNRSVSSDYWVKRAIDEIHSSKDSSKDSFVISDLRYKTEAKQLKEVFGDNVTFIRVNRFADSPSLDPSERDLDDFKFEYTIDNTGSLEEFYSKINNLLKLLK